MSTCLDSLAAQTHDAFEVICIDDGSTDNTGAILDERASSDSRFKVIHRKHRGPSNARNAGIATSAAPLITFADGDDYVSSRYLEALEAIIVRHEADMACCEFVNTRIGKRARVDDDANTVAKALSCCSVMDSAETMRQLALMTINFAFWGKIMTREIAQSCPFPENMVYEDVWNLGLVTACTKRVVYSPVTLYGYVSRKGSITRARPKPLSKFWHFRKAVEQFEGVYAQCLGLEHATDDAAYCLHLVHRLCAQYSVLEESVCENQERKELGSALFDELDAAYKLALLRGVSATHPQMIRAAVLLRSPKAHRAALTAYRYIKER